MSVQKHNMFSYCLLQKYKISTYFFSKLLDEETYWFHTIVFERERSVIKSCKSSSLQVTSYNFKFLTYFKNR